MQNDQSKIEKKLDYDEKGEEEIENKHWIELALITL